MIEQAIDAVLVREGGYVKHHDNRGGASNFGITEAVARAHGFNGPMTKLPRDEAAAIYLRLYWLRPRFNEVAERSERIAAELFDTGINMGPSIAATFLQRALTALNRNTQDYPDLTPDGRVGERTLAALDAFLKIRGIGTGEVVMLRALEALQGERYLRLAERRPANESFFYGWLANRMRPESMAMTRLPPKDKPTDAEVEAVYDKLPTHCYGPNKGQGFYSMSTIRAVLTAYFAARTPITSSAENELFEEIRELVEGHRHCLAKKQSPKLILESLLGTLEAKLEVHAVTAKLNSETGGGGE